VKSIGDILNASINGDKKQDKSYFMDILKRMKVPGNIAYRWVNEKPLDFLARKIVLLEYFKTTDLKIDSDIAFMKAAVDYDKWNEPEPYFEYAKGRAEQLLAGSDVALKVLGAYL
jgi:hypothetical protein